MSEIEGAYIYRVVAEPGITALQAGYEQAVHEGEQAMDTLLAYMPQLHKEILRGVAWILTLPPTPGIPAGWVAGRSIQKMHYPPVAHALATLCTRDLLQFDTTQGCYRLTPFGRVVAAALGEG